MQVLEYLDFLQGVRYRFRLINAGVQNCPIDLTVDNHTLTVISSDGSDVKPIKGEYLQNWLLLFHVGVIKVDFFKELRGVVFRLLRVQCRQILTIMYTVKILSAGSRKHIQYGNYF